MMKRILFPIAALALLLNSAAATEVVATNSVPADESPFAWTNPLVPQRADPHVFRHTDGYYYLAATVPRYDCIELRRAPTIGGLASAEPKVVWRRPARGAMAGPIWAPEIHFIQGKWYVYYSAGEGGKPWDSIRMFVMENDSANPLKASGRSKGRSRPSGIRFRWMQPPSSTAVCGITFGRRSSRASRAVAS